jgi:hypothetical protein
MTRDLRLTLARSLPDQQSVAQCGSEKKALEVMARIRADSDFLGEEAKVLMELGRKTSDKLTYVRAVML